MSDIAQVVVPSISTTPPDPDPDSHPENTTSTPNSNLFQNPDIHEHNLSTTSTAQSQSSPSQPPASTTPVIQPEESQPAAAAHPHQPAQTPAASAVSPSSEQAPSSPVEWGRNFWVTLVDPQSGSQFYACPSTGETTWDAPVGHFVLPPSSEGEWWELHDETRGGISYYYHTKTGETTWDKPDGFVIPLGVVQNTTLGRRLSQSTRRHSQLFPAQHHTPSQFQQQSQTDHSQSQSHSHSHSHSHAHGSSPSSYKTRRTQRHPHLHSHGHGHHGPPSVISERTEEVTEDPGLSSGWEKENQHDERREKDRERERDRDRERTRTPTKQSSTTLTQTPTRQASSASTSSRHQHHPHNHHPHNQQRSSPSRVRTKSQPNSSSGTSLSASSSSSPPVPGPGQSFTAAAEYIASGGGSKTNAGSKDTTSTPSRGSNLRKSRQNGFEEGFIPAASSSPVRRPATATASTSASNSNSHSHSSPSSMPSASASTSTSTSTSTTQSNHLGHPLSSSSLTNANAIIPEFSKLRKVSSVTTTGAMGVGVGTGTSLALMHAANANVNAGTDANSRQGGTFSTLPGARPQLQSRSFSASTPPSSVVAGANGKKRDRRNTGMGAGDGGGGVGKLMIGPPVLDIEKTLAMSPMRLGDAGAPIHVNVNVNVNSPITPSFYSHSPSYSGGERGRMSSFEHDRDGGTSSGPGSPTTPLNGNGNGSINGHGYGHGHYTEVDNVNLASNVSVKRLSTGPHPLLPRELVSDIQRFAQSDFAKKYFATHREGILFKRTVPLEKMMSWQKAPLTQPLLLTPKLHHKDATKAFKSIQRIMGDRDRDRSPSTTSNSNGGTNANTNGSNPASPLDSTSSLYHLHSSTQALLEEERTLLGEGISKGETLRDEIYCQVVKQLSGNPSPESVFRGWQLFCVLLITFPPTKSFEPYVRGFLESHAASGGAVGGGGHANGLGGGETTSRIGLMARHCLTRLDTISKRGPRGKPPSLLEIEIASDAAFNPSTFGEPLARIFKIQQRTYPALKIPIVLPFLTDGILALGGTKSEGIFRVSGDAELVSELRLRIDRGVYTLDGIDDPHVLASLFKLWLRELREPLVPTEMYNQCVACASDPERCVEMVKALPTLNRRVVLFVVSFLQLFLDDRIYRATKMSAEALSLVVAPNLMRCASDVVGVVVNNARYEQQFICNLLLHLRCAQIDPDYVPEHGRGALSSSKKSSNHGHHGHNRMQPSESSSGSGSNAGINARKVSSKRER